MALLRLERKIEVGEKKQRGENKSDQTGELGQFWARRIGQLTQLGASARVWCAKSVQTLADLLGSTPKLPCFVISTLNSILFPQTGAQWATVGQGAPLGSGERRWKLETATKSLGPVAMGCSREAARGEAARGEAVSRLAEEEQQQHLHDFSTRRNK